LGLVSHEGVHELHVGVVPNLDGLIPRGGNADSGLLSVVESDARDGIGVSVLVNSVLALSLDVPDLDLVITSTGEDLSAVSGKSDGEHISGVTDELGDGSSGGNVPETDGTVPRGGEAEASINGEADLVNEVGVSSEELLRSSPFSVVLVTLIFIELPLDKGLITTERRNSTFSPSTSSSPTAREVTQPP